MFERFFKDFSSFSYFFVNERAEYRLGQLQIEINSATQILQHGIDFAIWPKTVGYLAIGAFALESPKVTFRKGQNYLN